MIKKVSLAKTKLSTIEVLIPKALIASNISYIDFVSATMLKKYNDIK